MDKKNEDPFGIASMTSMWINTMNSQLEGMTGEWLSSQQGAEKPGEKSTHAKTRQFMEAGLKNYKSISGALATPESIAALLKGSGTTPEVLMKFAQSSLGGFLEMQQKMTERLSRMGSVAEGYSFDDVDENIFHSWTETYEKEFKQFFQIPQLGLMRTYQERANLVTLKSNLLQSTLAEFMNLLGLPFSRSLQVMQDKLGEMADSEEGLPEDSKVYYNMWVKVLEGHYMTLFQTPEYAETLSRTINTLADFSAAKDAMLEDVLSNLPVAKLSDFDDMARELYELKKRVRKLEKERLQNTK